MFGWLKKTFKTLLDKISLISIRGNNSAKYVAKLNSADERGEFFAHNEDSAEVLHIEKGFAIEATKSIKTPELAFNETKLNQRTKNTGIEIQK